MLKVRPPHGWRAVWWEFMIVTVGVLFALGAEQTLKGLDDRSELEAVRNSLRSEVRRNLAAVQFRIQMKPCIDRRLAELRTIFERHGSGRPLGIRARVGKPVYWSESTGTWQIALSGQALSNMTLADTLAFSEAFDAYQAFTRLLDEEDGHWRTLSLLDEAAILGEQDWPTLHRAFAEARALNARFVSVTDYIRRSATLGEPMEPPTLPPVAAEELRIFCRPMLD